MEHASTVDIGTQKRQRGRINEDSIATAIFENYHRQTSRPVGVFVLGDGVGGEASGDVASAIATTVVRKRLAETVLGAGTDAFDRFAVDAYHERPPTVAEDEDAESALSEERIRTAIQDGVDEAHRHVQDFAQEIGGRPATTLVVGVYHDGRLHYAWVGDSRLYLVNTKHEEIHQLTRDHAVTNELLDRGEIEDEEYARVHGDATAITRAIGGSAHGKPTVDVDFGTVEIYREDVILLTSDGLIDAFPHVGPLREEYQRAEDTEAVREKIRETLVSDEEIRDIVLESSTLSDAVERLVSFANERGGKDNLSVTLARDPTAEPSPDSLRPDDRPILADELIDQRTMIDSPEDGTPGAGDDAGDETAETADTNESDGDPGAESESTSESATDTPDDSLEIVSVGTGDPPRAAITTVGGETIYEIADGVTVGREIDEGGADIEIEVGEDAIVEPLHARLERNEEDRWHVRDTSSSGTYVEIDDGEWMLLLSSEGAALHRKHGFDPGATAERDLNESLSLRDGMAFTLEDPRSDDTRTFRFFSSVERARERASRDLDDGNRFTRFLV